MMPPNRKWYHWRGSWTLLIEIVRQLHEAFTAVSAPSQSACLVALRDKIAGSVGNRQFHYMVKDLPTLLEALRSNASITRSHPDKWTKLYSV
jgi:hypothetical protein